MQNVILNSFQNLTPVRGGQPVGHCPSDAPQNIINGASNDAPCLLPHCPIAFGCWVSQNLHSKPIQNLSPYRPIALLSLYVLRCM